LGIAVDDHGTPKKIFGLTIGIANNPERSLKIMSSDGKLVKNEDGIEPTPTEFNFICL
jgi:hypothetical protein